MRANASALLEVQVELGRQIILLKEKHELDNKYGTWGKRLDNFIKGLSAEATICGEDSNVNLIAKSSIYKYKYIAENWGLVLERGWRHLSFSTVYDRLKAEAKGQIIQGDEISELQNQIEGMKELNLMRGRSASRIQQELVLQINTLQLELDAVKAKLEAREAEIRARDAEIEVTRLQLQVAESSLESANHNQPQDSISEASEEPLANQSDELGNLIPHYTAEFVKFGHAIASNSHVQRWDQRRVLEAKRELGRLLVEQQKQWRYRGASNSSWLRDGVPELIGRLTKSDGLPPIILSKASVYRYMDIYKYWDTLVKYDWLDLSCTEIAANLSKLKKEPFLTYPNHSCSKKGAPAEART
jgi:hypothetical protein